MRLSDTDYGRRPPVQDHRAADDVLRAVKRVLPHVITDYEDPGAVEPHVVRVEASALDQIRAERFEVVRRHERGFDGKAAVVLCEGQPLKVNGGQRTDGCAVFEKMEIRTIAVVGLDVTVGSHPTHSREIVRVDPGSWFPENPVGDRKHGRVAANDDRNQHDGGCADCGGLRQNAQAEPEILEELLEPRRYPHGTRLLLDTREVPKRASRGPGRVRFGLPARHVIAGLLREVKTKLVVQFAVRACRERRESDERSNAGPQHDPSRLDRGASPRRTPQRRRSRGPLRPASASARSATARPRRSLGVGGPLRRGALRTPKTVMRQRQRDSRDATQNGLMRRPVFDALRSDLRRSEHACDCR